MEVEEFLNKPLIIENAKLFLQSCPMHQLLENASEPQAVEVLERLFYFEEIRNSMIANQEIASLFRNFGFQNRQLFFDVLLKMQDDIGDDLQLWDLIVESIGQSDLALHSLASKLALKGPVESFTTQIYPRLRQIKPSVSDEIRFRILQLGLDASKKGAVVDDIYGWILEEFFTDDVLLKLNSIELLGQLGHFPQGIEYIRKVNVEQKLIAELDNCFDQTLEVTIVRLLALLARTDSKILSVLKPRLHAYLDGDAIGRATALYAFGHLLNGEQEEILQWPWIESCMKAISGTHDEIAKEALAAWISGIPFLARVKPELIDEALLEVVKCISKPYPDLRSFAWQFLEITVKQGLIDTQKKILGFDVMRENLLDFSKEMIYEPKVAKHGFVIALSNLPWIGEFLTPELHQVLVAYAKGGPFYTPLNSKVEISENTGN